jgi:hypothetical protein
MSEQRQERASPERGPSIAFGIFAGLLLLARLLRLSAEGLSASFDSAIYIRNLWGIAQGDWHNPLVNDHIFGVHGNWVLLLLAPLVRFADPALLLTLSQGLALGATAGLLHYGFLEALGQRASRGRRLAAATLLSAGLLAGPVAINPFLFDLRPDMLGLPLLLAGLLRARRQGFDGAALAWMGAALFVREDFGMVIIGAMATAPFGRSLLSNWQRLRWPSSQSTGSACGAGWHRRASPAQAASRRRCWTTRARCRCRRSSPTRLRFWRRCCWAADCCRSSVGGGWALQCRASPFC